MQMIFQFYNTVKPQNKNYRDHFYIPWYIVDYKDPPRNNLKTCIHAHLTIKNTTIHNSHHIVRSTFLKRIHQLFQTQPYIVPTRCLWAWEMIDWCAIEACPYLTTQYTRDYKINVCIISPQTFQPFLILFDETCHVWHFNTKIFPIINNIHVNCTKFLSVQYTFHIFSSLHTHNNVLSVYVQ